MSSSCQTRFFAFESNVFFTPAQIGIASSRSIGRTLSTCFCGNGILFFSFQDSLRCKINRKNQFRQLRRMLSNTPIQSANRRSVLLESAASLAKRLFSELDALLSLLNCRCCFKTIPLQTLLILHNQITLGFPQSFRVFCIFECLGQCISSSFGSNDCLFALSQL